MNESTHPQPSVGSIVEEFEREFLAFDVAITSPEQDPQFAKIAETILKESYKNWLRTHLSSLLQSLIDEAEAQKYKEPSLDEYMFGFNEGTDSFITLIKDRMV